MHDANGEVEPVPFDSEEAWPSSTSSDGPAGEIRWGPDSMPPRADVHDDHDDDVHDNRDDHQNMSFSAAVVPGDDMYATYDKAAPVKQQPVKTKKLMSSAFGGDGNGDAFGGLKPTARSLDKRGLRRPPRASGASKSHAPSHAAGMFGVLVLASIVGYYAIKRGGYSQFMDRVGGGGAAHEGAFPTACKEPFKVAFVRMR